MSPITVEEHEALVRDLMENWGLDEITARFAISLQHGDTSGCSVEPGKPRTRWSDDADNGKDAVLSG